ncbi:MAG: hypothetical protein IPL61_21655 [Myxococcales bacterium]|nr:hypothetical protein [Myxococcales bacterium]
MVAVVLVSLATVAPVASVVTVAHAGVEGSVVVQGGAEIHPVPPPQRRYRRHRGPRLMAPMRIDIGAIGADSDYGLLSGAEASIGIHWASLSPEPTTFDVGLGVFGGAMTNGRTPLDAAGDHQVLSYGGVYGEFGKTLSGGDYWRTWALGRGEYLGSDGLGESRTSLGASAKLEAEVYLSGVGVSPEGLFLGTYAIGVYAEAAVRQLGADVGRLQFGLGLTIRTPLVWKW